MLTAKAQELDKVRGLNLGRTSIWSSPWETGTAGTCRRPAASCLYDAFGSCQTYTDSALSLDFARHEAFIRGEKVALTPTEYRLLSYLVQHPDQVLTLQQLWDRIWGWTGGSLESVKWHIAYLRKKIESNPEKPELIVTVRGVGYRYQKPTA
jgi:DNA-binding response OmpR family regulator